MKYKELREILEELGAIYSNIRINKIQTKVYIKLKYIKK